MKILFISDTHGQHRKLKNLPEADMLIHGGDITYNGTEEEVVDFVDWLDSLKYKYKIFIAGNHDECLDSARIEEGLPENCLYLSHSGVTIEGVKIWGMPYFLSDDYKGLMRFKVAAISRDADILISHLPPLGVLDKSTFGENMGNEDLRCRVEKIKPKLHLFGHIHEAYGMHESPHTTYINGSVLDENYELVNQPIVIEI